MTGNSANLVRDEPQLVEVEIVLTEPGLVVLADQFYPGWEASSISEETGDTRRLPILRTNLATRGVVLPTGKHRLIFRYRPPSFFVGAAVSGTSWCALLLVVVLRHMRR